MKTAGQLLKQLRIQKKFSIKRVARATKIRSVYLRALEADEYDQLPSITSARGFIKNYAEFLGLSSGEVLAVFRRDFDEGKIRKTVEAAGTPAGIGPGFNWTPKITSVVAILILLALFIVYLIWQHLSLVNAPYY